MYVTCNKRNIYVIQGNKENSVIYRKNDVTSNDRVGFTTISESREPLGAALYSSTRYNS